MTTPDPATIMARAMQESRWWPDLLGGDARADQLVKAALSALTKAGVVIVPRPDTGVAFARGR